MSIKLTLLTESRKISARMLRKGQCDGLMRHRNFSLFKLLLHHLNLYGESGFSKLFFEHADEEREHGVKFLDYLNMRGGPTPDPRGLVKELFPILGKDTWADGGEALRDALTMEKKVSGSIHAMIKQCDDVVDFHAADWLTATWLPEQLEGQRKLAGLINNLDQFKLGHEHLADWMFSNQLLG